MYADAVHRRNRGVRCSQDDAVRPRFVGVFSSDATIFSFERLRVKTACFLSKQVANDQDYFGCARYVELIEVSALKSGQFSSVVNLRIVPRPLCLPDDYLRSMEPLITIVVGCMC